MFTPTIDHVAAELGAQTRTVHNLGLNIPPIERTNRRRTALSVTANVLPNTIVVNVQEKRFDDVTYS